MLILAGKQSSRCCSTVFEVEVTLSGDCWAWCSTSGTWSLADSFNSGFTVLELQCFPLISYLIYPDRFVITVFPSLLCVDSASPALELCCWAALFPTSAFLALRGLLVQKKYPPYVGVMGIVTQPCWVFQHQLQTLFMLVATCLDIQSPWRSSNCFLSARPASLFLQNWNRDAWDSLCGVAVDRGTQHSHMGCILYRHCSSSKPLLSRGVQPQPAPEHKEQIMPFSMDTKREGSSGSS